MASFGFGTNQRSSTYASGSNVFRMVENEGKCIDCDLAGCAEHQSVLKKIENFE